MTGWEVQEMWEADAAAEWERLNASDPAELEMEQAAVEMKKGADLIDKAENALVDAVSRLDGYPMADRVESLLNDLMDLRVDIESLADKYERGLRE